jgi:hypothetical protein
MAMTDSVRGGARSTGKVPPQVHVVSDHVRTLNRLYRTLVELEVRALPRSCDDFLAGFDRVDDDDIVLLDPVSVSRNQGREPGMTPRSPFVSFDVADAVRSRVVDGRPRIVAVSDYATVPEIAIGLHGLGDVFAARFDLDSLVRDLPCVLRGDYRSRLEAPSAHAYAKLGIGPNAQLAAAVHEAKRKDEVWTWVCDVAESHRSHADKTRAWVRRKVAPHLDIQGRTAADAVALVRRVTGIACDPFLRGCLA